ncbi:hypothetical protein CW304_17240 [Bacillus sp. UFRGS-B20]|nr:hypothetical protein CW304_17240 [Bacillus sp. UFRGS-B20]
MNFNKRLIPRLFYFTSLPSYSWHFISDFLQSINRETVNNLEAFNRKNKFIAIYVPTLFHFLFPALLLFKPLAEYLPYLVNIF